MATRVTPNDLSERVAANCRRLRLQRKWSAKRLAELLADVGCPISRSVIANRESGSHVTSHVSVDELYGLAKVFDVAVEVLVAERVMCPRCEGEPPIGFTCNLCGEAIDTGVGPATIEGSAA